MDVDVILTDWEQECCGARISLNQVVTWDIFIRPQPFPGEGERPAGLTQLIESHHDMLTGGARVTGRVARIRAGRPEDLTDIQQIWGSDDLADGVEYGLDIAPQMFVVTLSLSDGAELPSRPAEPKLDIS